MDLEAARNGQREPRTSRAGEGKNKRLGNKRRKKRFRITA